MKRLLLLLFSSQVLVLRELAVSAPTFFFQQVQPFFDNIFNAVWDPKQAIREGAVSALRACLILTTQRETKEMQKPQWYKVRSFAVSLLIECHERKIHVLGMFNVTVCLLFDSKPLRRRRKALMRP